MPDDKIEIHTTHWSVTQIAKVLNVTDRTVRNWIYAGLLPAARFGLIYRIADVDFQAFVRRARKEADRVRRGGPPGELLTRVSELSRDDVIEPERIPT